MRAKLMGLLKDEEGQGMVEYGLLIAGVAVIVVAAVSLLDFTTLFAAVMAKINGEAPAP